MAQAYGCTKTYPYEYIKLATYDKVACDLKRFQIITSKKKSPSQEDVDEFNNANRHKTRQKLAIKYLQDYLNV